MAAAALAELEAPQPRRRFTVGINDDVTHLLPRGRRRPRRRGRRRHPRRLLRARRGRHRQLQQGRDPDHRRAHRPALPGPLRLRLEEVGATTVSHLRFGPRPIRSTYEIRRAGFVAVHDPSFLDRFDVLDRAAPGATVLLNSPFPADEVWARLPVEAQRTLVERGCRLFTIDAHASLRSTASAGASTPPCPTCFFALSGVLPRDEAMAAVKDSVAADLGRRGDEVVRRNVEAIDAALAELHEVPAAAWSNRRGPSAPPSPPTRPSSSSGSPGCCSRATAIACRSSAFPPTAPGRPARAATRSGRSRSRSPSGIPSCACSATAAR